MRNHSLSDWLNQAPYTLALSSSFFGFFAHCGVAEALYGANLLPSKITGSSAGALVGGALASGHSPEYTKSLLFQIRREDFWDPSFGFGYLRGRKFLDIVEKHYSSDFNRTTIPFEAAAFDLYSLRTRFLREGSLPRAVVASCAVPALFQPVRIGSRLYLDGGVFHKSGISPHSKEERVLCVFLQGDGFSDSYELGKSLRGLEPHHKVVRLKNLTRLNYNSLEKGKSAFTEAFSRVRSALDKKWDGSVLDA